MPPEPNFEPDFDSQLRGLFHQAEQQIGDKEAASRRAEEEKEQEVTRRVEERMAKSYVSIPQMLGPLVEGLKAATRATGENTTVLHKLEKSNEQSAAANTDLPALLTGLQGLLDQKNNLNQRMFDALHEELKGYKDSFLLESVHKPVIRDLISLYDDLTTIHRQMSEAEHEAADVEGGVGGKLHERLRTMENNLGHNCEFVLEVLARLEVFIMPISSGKHDRSQSAVAVELTDDPDDDGLIVRTVKRGFTWKGRPIRPEQVIIKKWKEGFAMSFSGGAANARK